MKKIIWANILLLFIICTILVVSQTSSVEVQQAKMVLKTDKLVYFLGENITVMLKNIGDEPVQIGGYPAWMIYTYPENEPVYPAIFAYLLWWLAPGENDTHVWAQYNGYTGEPVRPGFYIVKDLEGWGLSTIFVIIDLTEGSGSAGGGCGGSRKLLV